MLGFYFEGFVDFKNYKVKESLFFLNECFNLKTEYY